MEILICSDKGARESPLAVLALHDQVQRPIHGAVQPPDITRPISLGHTVLRPLNRHPVLLGNNLRIVTDTHLRVLEQRIVQSLGLAQRIADLDLVIPRPGRLAVIHAELLRDRAFPVLDFEVPVEQRGGVGLEVHGRDEGHAGALVETLLVEVERRLERSGFRRQERRTRQDDARLDAVMLFRGALGRLERHLRGGWRVNRVSGRY